jgi:cytochrome d ubiquinol oxidase subunit I
VPGLKEFPREDRPNSLVLFWAFRLMAGIGFLFLFVMIWAALLWKRKRVFVYRPLLWTLVAIQPLGWLATELGWIVTEVGRQPWLVYNILRTADGVSPIRAGNVVWSLSLFLIIFVAIGSSYFYFVFKVMRTGPDLTSPIPPAHIPPGLRALEPAPRSGQEEEA